MRNFGIAAVQMKVDPKDKESNLSRMTRIIDDISVDSTIDLIAFPEFAVTGMDVAQAEPISGPSWNRLRYAAKTKNKWVMTGSGLELSNGEIYNAALLISPGGDIAIKYRKTHPFLPMESTTPGNEYPVYDIDNVGRFGIMICYDGLAFPEVARTLAWKGAEVILWPAMVAAPHADFWGTTCKAHSIFNQCFVVGISAVGLQGSFSGVGHTQVVDPNGVVLSELDSEEGILVEILDLDDVARVRRIGSKHGHTHLKDWKHFSHQYPPYVTGIDKGEVFNMHPFNE